MSEPQVGDNQSVLASCGIPDSILTKESQSGPTKVLPACVEAKGFCQTTTAPYLPNHESSEGLLQYVSMCGLGMEVVHVRTASFLFDVLCLYFCEVGGCDINHWWEEVTAMSEPS
jgi:hypothetical protein